MNMIKYSVQINRKFSSIFFKHSIQSNAYQKFDKKYISLSAILLKLFKPPAYYPIKQFTNSSNYQNDQKQIIYKKCWKCNTTIEPTAAAAIPIKQLIPTIFCEKCGIIQEPKPIDMDYFTIFGMDKKFGLDTVELTSTFRRLQSFVHPDKFSNKSQIEQNLSAEWSSLINKIYKTLLTPIKRGEYILKLHNIEVEENASLGSGFLLEMMERNEEVDDANSPDELKSLLEKVRIDVKKNIMEFDEFIQANDLNEAKKKLILLRYMLSLENSIKTKLIKLNVHLH